MEEESSPQVVEEASGEVQSEGSGAVLDVDIQDALAGMMNIHIDM